MLRPVIFLLMLILAPFLGTSQAAYNSCSNALELCPGTVFSVTNIDANATVCPGCEDDFNFCFPTDNTIWFSFTTTAAGGDVQIDFFNLVFEGNPGQDNELQATLIETIAPCNSPTYIPLGNCVSNAVGNFTLNAFGLLPNTSYMIVVDGDNSGVGITSPAECTFDISISGTAVDRPLPTIGVLQNSDSICLNETVQFEATLANCPDTGSFQWFVNGTLVAVTSTPIFESSGLSDGDLVHVETSCYVLCPVVVGVDALPVSVYSFNVYAGEDLTIAPGEVAPLNGQTSAPSFSWSPTYLFSDPFSLSTFCEPEQTITVTLSATENGCTLGDFLTITVISDLEIPNTFSPNGDQINDSWVIQGIELYPNNALNIYDRWGQQVYQTTGYSKVKAWDGSVKSGLVSESVYFYVLDLLNDGSEIIKGSITVIR